MLSVSYAGKNAYIAGKTSGVLRGGVSVANRCYVLTHCGGGVHQKITEDNNHKERGACKLRVLLKKIITPRISYQWVVQEVISS